jgi:predicted glycoside hydrolase/deacetylase ChbG (UPF0249 family)
MTPQRLVLFTADDFGLSPATTEGIVDCCKHGTVTRVSLMVNMPHAEEAFQAVRSMPHVQVGLHLNLVKGRPLSPPDRVQSLVDRQGGFLSLLPLAQRLAVGQVRREQLAEEIRAQFRWVSERGGVFRYVDSHRHTHLLSPIFELVQDAARDAGVAQIRIPITRGHVPGARSPKQLALQLLARRAEARLTAPAEPVAGAYAELRLLTRPGALERFLRTAEALGTRRVEIGCHPGFPDKALRGIESKIHDRDAERRLLTDATLRHRLRECGWDVEGTVEQFKEAVVCG